NIDGKTTFSYIQVFVRQDGILYSGKWTDRFNSPKLLEDLQELKQIPTEDRGPEVKSTWSAIYMKTPSLLGNLEKQIARKIETYEFLRNLGRTFIQISRSTMAIRIPTVKFLNYVSNDIRQREMDQLGRLLLCSPRNHFIFSNYNSKLEMGMTPEVPRDSHTSWHLWRPLDQ
ncbi:hypothetical protein N7541_006075, partial [Penicillium brevicompactum]